MNKEQIIKSLKEIKNVISVTCSNTIESITTKKEDLTTSINKLEKNTQEVIGLKDILSKVELRGSIPNFILEGYESADIKEKNGVNYLEFIYRDGKARVICQKLDDKSIFPNYNYNIDRKFNGENGLVSYKYNTQNNRADYTMCVRDENCVSNIKGQVKSTKKNVSYIEAASKVYTYRSLELLKPFFNFNNEKIEIVSNVVNGFRSQYLPTYEDTYTCKRVGEKVTLEYNGEDNFNSIESYNEGLGMKVGFESYINGEMRPLDALVRILK